MDDRWIGLLIFIPIMFAITFVVLLSEQIEHLQYIERELLTCEQIQQYIDKFQFGYTNYYARCVLEK